MPDSSLPTSWSRVVIAGVKPQVDGGRWPSKRSVGEEVTVWAGLIVDGHDKIAAELFFRHEDDVAYRSRRMRLRYNDEYHADFPIERLGRYSFYIQAWVDAFASWQDQFRRRVEGGDSEYEIESELQDGASILRRAAEDADAEGA